MSFEKIRKSLPTKPVSPPLPFRHNSPVSLFPIPPFSQNHIKPLSPIQITSYTSPTGTDSTNLGWVRPGDPRSELVLSLFKESHGLSVMLNGLSPTALSTPPPRQKITAISPMAQLKAGRYKVPTFIIHGDRDEIAPFGDSEAFVGELRKRGVEGGLGRVSGARHIHDLAMRPGGKGWEEGVGVGYDFVFGVVGRSGNAGRG